MVPGVGESDDEATKTIPILSPVLWHSGVMQRLRDLQSTLDGTDISHLAQRFAAECLGSDLFDPTLLPEPSAEELRQFIDLYLSDPHAGKSDKWSLRESLVAYALSATFKDCSVFITCPLVSTSDGWKLDEPQATVKVIDLDLKPLANMRKWYDLDEKIWRHWQDTKSVSSKADVQPDNQLATPAQISRSAIPSRLASSSTEALYMPTPDRQVDNPMDYPGTTPSFESGLAISGQDASSTRALHSKTPEDSQPCTPKAVATSTSETPASMSLSDALFISPSAATPASMSLSDALFISPSAAITNTEQLTPASMSFSDALFISPSAAMTIANENGRRGSNFGLEESPMKDLNSHGYDEGLEGNGEEVLGSLKPQTPNRTTRSAGPSPSPGLVDATSEIATGNKSRIPSDPSADHDHSPADDFTFPPKVTLIGPETTITNGNNDTAFDTKSNSASDIASPSPLNTHVVTGQDTHEQASESGQAVSDGDLPPPPSEDGQQQFRSIIAGITEIPIKEEIETTEPKALEQEVTQQDIVGQEVDKPEHLHPVPSIEEQQHFRSIIAGVTEVPGEGEAETTEPKATEPEHLPPVPSAEDQQHFRSTIAGITEEPIKPKVETMDQEITGPISKISDHHSDPEATDSDTVTVPAIAEQSASTSDVTQSVDQEQSDIPGSNLAEDRSTTPLADRQQRLRAILSGVVNAETTDIQSTEMDATVPSLDSEEPSLTPPFVTPMTFMDEVEPTYPETNEGIHSTSTATHTGHETKPLETRDSTAP